MASVAYEESNNNIDWDGPWTKGWDNLFCLFLWADHSRMGTLWIAQKIGCTIHIGYFWSYIDHFIQRCGWIRHAGKRHMCPTCIPYDGCKWWWILIEIPIDQHSSRKNNKNIKLFHH
jgi:hypothetical protein